FDASMLRCFDSQFAGAHSRSLTDHSQFAGAHSRSLTDHSQFAIAVIGERSGACGAESKRTTVNPRATGGHQPGGRLVKSGSRPSAKAARASLLAGPPMRSTKHWFSRSRAAAISARRGSVMTRLHAVSDEIGL